MEPKKVIKKVSGFSLEKRGRLFNNIPRHEPRRQIRYMLEIPLNGGVVELLVQCSGLQHTLNRNTTNHIVNTSWSPLEIKIIDVIGNIDPREIYRRLQEWFGDVSLDRDYTTFKRRITLSALDPTGVTIHKYDLIGCFPTVIRVSSDYDHDYHELFYGIEMTLLFDSCVVYD